MAPGSTGSRPNGGDRGGGRVAGTLRLDNDGALVPAPIVDTTDVDLDEARVLLTYHYGPDLLPPQHAGPWSMWRYRDLLPLDDAPIAFPLPVGGTPLVASPRLRRLVGVDGLWLKDETRGPSASSKDRATALVIESGLRQGADVITAASTGNVAISTALGAAAAGMQAVIFAPASVPELKLRAMRAAGADVHRIAEGYDAAFRLSRLAARELGWLDRNTGVNPLTVEAKKTVAFEVWEQMGRVLPDVVAAPVGDGITLSGLAKGFRELRECGVTDRLPRLVGVQATGCSPLVHSWESDAKAPGHWPGTIADGIAVARPVGGSLVLRDVRESGGALLAVSDDDLLEAVAALARHAGLLAEPAAAAGLAGVTRALRRGSIAPDERVVVVVTSSGWKTPEHLPDAGATGPPSVLFDEVRRLIARRRE